MSASWLSALNRHVEACPVVLIRFGAEEWGRLHESRNGPNEFTLVRPHDSFDGVHPPTACLIFGDSDDFHGAYFGLLKSKKPVATLDTRITIKRAQRIQPGSVNAVAGLLADSKPHETTFRKKLKSPHSVVALSPKLSSYLITRLAEIDANRGPMRTAMASLSAPRQYRGPAALQQDAIQTALKAFGLTLDDKAISVHLVSGRGTALERVNIVEDAVIEHDARHIPSFDLAESHLTGHAVFEKAGERLDVYTANKRELEKVFGVDLIYLNTKRQNVVMLQYKMLEPETVKDAATDWVFRPDAQLDKEIARMKRFSRTHAPGPFEYRLNPEVFYIKFVHRDGSLGHASIVTPIEHFERLRSDPACTGPRGGVRISFETLDGRYLRQDAFLDLIRSGYIGAHAETTAHLKWLVEKIVQGDKAVVAAIQSSGRSSSFESSECESRETDFNPLEGIEKL